MSGDADMIKLYSQRILALSAEIPHLERLSAPQATAKKRSPLCGSTVTVDLTLKDGRIAEYGQDVKACALGQASAAISGKVIIGRNRDEIASAHHQLTAMLKSDGPLPEAPFDGYDVLQPAKDFKNRHASILLTLDATLDAFDKALELAA
ncbi:MAG: iron-sulfur cluster assembly scaffold protein [Pseudomonadota bacterium]